MIKFLLILVIVLAAGAAVWKIVQARAEENAELNSISKLPASVGHVVAQMDTNTQAAFFHEYQKNKKSLVVAYVCWFFFSVHYFYFKKPGWNIALWASYFIALGFVWWVVDFFRMPSIRRDYNEGAARQAIQTLSLGSSFGQVHSPNPVPPQSGSPQLP